MKKYFIILFLVCLIVIICFSVPNYIKNVFANTPSEKPLLIIDAGHGGFDSGAIAIDGTLEKDINLSIAKKLSSIAELSGFEVIMVREDDIAVCDNGLNTLRNKKVSDIHNRLNLTSQYRDGIFLSIHQNSFGESKYWGTQVFYGHKNINSKLLADKIQASIVNSLQNKNHREIKKAEKNLYILYNTDSIAVMVECGFLSNREECKLLQLSTYQQKLAFEIVKALTDFCFLSENI